MAGSQLAVAVDYIYVSAGGTANTAKIVKFDVSLGSSAAIEASATIFADSNNVGSTFLAYPTQMAFDSNGNLFVANFASSSIGKFDSSGNGSVFATGVLGALGVAVDASNNVYASQATANIITKYTSGGTGSTFADNSSTSFLNSPRGMVFDSSGNLYVGNYTDNTIAKVTSAGSQSTFVNSGLSGPASLAIDTGGNLYATNFNNSSVTKITPAASTSTFANSSVLGAPSSISFDSAGNVYVLNNSNGHVVKYNSGGVYQFEWDVLTASSGLIPYGLVTQTVVPEPSTFALAGIGAGIIALVSRRRKTCRI